MGRVGGACGLVGVELGAVLGDEVWRGGAGVQGRELRGGGGGVVTGGGVSWEELWRCMGGRCCWRGCCCCGGAGRGEDLPVGLEDEEFLGALGGSRRESGMTAMLRAMRSRIVGPFALRSLPWLAMLVWALVVVERGDRVDFGFSSDGGA